MLALLLGCGPSPSPDAGRLSVVVGIPPLAWIVEQLGGDRVEVEVLLPPGASPETWQPSDGAVGRLLAADAYLRIGVALERGRWMQTLRDRSTPRVVDLAAALGLDHAGADPHVWTSPTGVRSLAREIHAGLAPLDPSGAAAWDRGLERLELRLDELESRIGALLEPWAGRPFLVYHPAWEALAQDVGLVQEAVEVDGSPPSDRRLTELRRLVRDEGLRVLFTDPRTGGPAAERAAEALGLETSPLDPLPRDLEAGLLEAAAALAGSFEHSGATAEVAP